jgi:amino acid permease
MFSRDELLGGLPARRASTLLFAIESRTAQQVARSRSAMATYLTDRTAADRERAFLDAMSGGRGLPIRPTIQDIERYAADWAALVPDGPDQRAAILARLAATYRLPAARTPRIAAALSSDDPAVAAAYERVQGAPIATAFATDVPWRERLRWTRSAVSDLLEHLPTTATAFALTLAGTVGAGILALPIAFGGVGPLIGVAILVVFGFVNLLTVAALVEAVTRSGSMRHGHSYFGRLVDEYLGRTGGLVLSPTLAILDLVGLTALLIGFGTTLGSATGIPAAVFVAVLATIILVVVRRDGIPASVASALVIGAVNVTLLVVIAALALTHLDPANLAVPAGLGPGDLGAVGGLIFGVVLAAYFGHTSAGSAAKVVLRRDPSGRSLLRGSVLAMVTLIALYSLVVVAIGGAVPADRLVGFEGTALTPLAAVVGPSVDVLGSIYVVVAMGVGAIYVSLGLAHLIEERLPAIDVAGGGRLARVAAGENGRFILRALPVLVLLPVLEWMLLTGRASFSDPISILGALAIPLLAGAFPVLMLAAARRRGEYLPAAIIGPLGWPAVVAGLFVLFVVGPIVQGVAVFTEPATRIASILVAAVMVVVALVAVRGGSFRSRAVVELRREAHAAGRGFFRVVAAGRAAAVPVRLVLAGETRDLVGSSGELARFGDLRSAIFDLSDLLTDDIEVWVHEVTGHGASTPIPATVVADGSDPALTFNGTNGRYVSSTPIDRRAIRVTPRTRTITTTTQEG